MLEHMTCCPFLIRACRVDFDLHMQNKYTVAFMPCFVGRTTFVAFVAQIASHVPREPAWREAEHTRWQRPWKPLCAFA